MKIGRTLDAERIYDKKENHFLTTLKRLFRNKAAIIAGCVLIIVILAAIFAPNLSSYRYDQINLMEMNQGPSLKHWFGTDDLGRDLFSRIIYGGRYSVTISIIAVLCALFFGIILGAIAGFFGGVLDNVITRCLDIVQAVPDTIMTIALSTALGSGFDKTVIALAFSRIAAFARILRANVLSVRSQEYVEAAEASGCSKMRRIVKYIIPNAWTPLIVSGTMQVGNIILSLAALGYIGLGIQPPLPEWGSMLSSARGYLRDYPYQLIFPGVAIAICVLCINLLGDGLRDALDPKLKD